MSRTRALCGLLAAVGFNPATPAWPPGDRTTKGRSWPPLRCSSVVMAGEIDRASLRMAPDLCPSRLRELCRPVAGRPREP